VPAAGPPGPRSHTETNVESGPFLFVDVFVPGGADEDPTDGLTQPPATDVVTVYAVSHTSGHNVRAERHAETLPSPYP
jgi:hypothetical protein